jgi:hypothetical protein
LSTAPSRDLEEPGMWVLPFALSLDKLDLITKACFQAKADTMPVSVEDISKRTGVHARNTMPNLRFLASIGVLMLDKSTKKYTLSQKGAEYAKSLGSGDEERAGELLKELLPGSHLRELLGFTEVQGDALTYEVLFNHIKTLARVGVGEQGEVSSGVKAGIRCLVSVLGRAGYVSSEISDQAEAGKPVTTNVRKAIRQSREKGRIEARMATDSPESDSNGEDQSAASPFNINILIEAKDPESIKQVMELIRQLRNVKES